MISPVYVAEQLWPLLHGQTRMIGVDRKQAWALIFPALHEIASECLWSIIPSALLPILRSLRTKPHIPLQCAETVDCELLDSAAEQDHVFMPSQPVCRRLPPFAADLDKGGDE
ncbi:hypothetical protein CVIRNUC_000304 [Coccomyxa viridis]|uniref:Uncharacterized protein n=1 Tax=Coccomyxa viridis TaxID=1274662 RepID=A0AAV1HTD9_9CHLO|nr:hypothetical protein CVIRNUC_000304 [Coccomyxa viridis]